MMVKVLRLLDMNLRVHLLQVFFILLFKTSPSDPNTESEHKSGKMLHRLSPSSRALFPVHDIQVPSMWLDFSGKMQTYSWTTGIFHLALAVCQEIQWYPEIYTQQQVLPPLEQNATQVALGFIAASKAILETSHSLHLSNYVNAIQINLLRWPEMVTGLLLLWSKRLLLITDNALGLSVTPVSVVTLLGATPNLPEVALAALYAMQWSCRTVQSPLGLQAVQTTPAEAAQAAASQTTAQHNLLTQNKAEQ